MEEKLDDVAIREVIFRNFLGSSGKSRILEEFPMGDSRADLLLITQTKLVGLEIKSDRDTFARLSRQVRDYERFFDSNYLVVGTYHVEEALQTVPKHWGIYEVYENESGELVLECIRQAAVCLKDNTEEKLFLLWRNELNAILSEYGLSHQRMSRKEKMIAKIMRGLPQSVIATEVCHALLNREYKE